MRVPLSWLRDYVDVDVPVDRARATAAVHELRGWADRDARRRRYGRQPRPLPRGPRARGGQAPQRRPAPAVLGRRGGGRAAPDRLRSVELRGRRNRRGRAARRRAPGRAELERAKLRGSVSDGMILSEQELELGDDHAGIIVLPDEWEPGTPLATHCRSPTSCSSSRRRTTGPTCSASTASPVRWRRSSTWSWRRRPASTPSWPATSR